MESVLAVAEANLSTCCEPVDAPGRIQGGKGNEGEGNQKPDRREKMEPATGTGSGKRSFEENRRTLHTGLCEKPKMGLANDSTNQAHLHPLTRRKKER